jgi:8-oxo-dGTP diphosphatase
MNPDENTCGRYFLISTRFFATAFLFNGPDLLMMKRSPSARLLPGMWAPVGGHIEVGEFGAPQVACEREIHEETGLASDDISSLSLRYIVHRLRQTEIRIQFSYFGFTTKSDLASTEEGELHWMPFEQVPALEVSAATRFTLEHYARIGSLDNAIYVGSLYAQDGQPEVTWSTIRDWE